MTPKPWRAEAERLLAEGKTAHAVGKALGISHHTVRYEFDIRNERAKSRARTREYRKSFGSARIDIVQHRPTREPSPANEARKASINALAARHVAGEIGLAEFNALLRQQYGARA